MEMIREDFSHVGFSRRRAAVPPKFVQFPSTLIAVANWDLHCGWSR